MKINFGCGADYRSGWLNVDQSGHQAPDLVLDIEQTPWPIESDYADYVLFKHVLEHVGKDSKTFLAIVQELYRICKPDALIEIHVPHPLHSDFMGDPTHVRPIIPEMFQCFNLASVEQWQMRGLPGTPLAIYMKVDFETIETQYFLDPSWQGKVARGETSMEEVVQAARAQANVIQWIKIVLRARKPFKAGRSLEGLAELRLIRAGGLGDVIMALQAASAVAKLSDVPIVFQTLPAYRMLAAACPFIAQVVTEPDEASALEAKYAEGGAHLSVDLNAANYGLSRMHEVDAFLRMGLGIDAPPALKGLRIEPPAAVKRRIAGKLDNLAPFPSRGRVLLHPSDHDPNRTWPRDCWQELAAQLVAEGHQVISIGRRESEGGGGIFALDDVYELTDALDPIETISLMDQSDLLVATDSGPIQLAGLSEIGIVGIYSVVAGRNRLPYRNGEMAWRASAVSPQCAFHPCYERIFGSDEYNAYCQSSAKSPGENAAFLANWCLNESRFSCMTQEIKADRVIEACQALLAEREEDAMPAVAKSGTR